MNRRIVVLERLWVEYKAITSPDPRQQTRYRVRKKEFCRLVKNATLLPPQRSDASSEDPEKIESSANAE